MRVIKMAWGIGEISEGVYTVVPLDPDFARRLFEGDIPEGSFYQTVTLYVRNARETGVFLFVCMPEVDDMNAVMMVIDAFFASESGNSESPLPFNPSLN